ncbi:MAG: S53 family peptidase [Ktedonobacteraceae bacterium]
MSDSQFQHKVVLRGSERQAPPPEAEVVGAPDPDEVIEVSIMLPTHKSIDEEEIYDRAIAGLPPLSREEVVARFSADENAMEQVKSFARLHGLSVDEQKTSAQKRVVVVSGSTQAIAGTFDVHLQRYVHNGISFRGRTGPLYIPGELNGIITGVFGIDDRPQLRARAVRHVVTPYTPVQVAGHYEFPAGEDGTGQCISIIELGGGYRTSDLQAYFAFLQVSMPKVVSIPVDGFDNNPGVDMGADEEVGLDIEVAGAVAPGATIAVYFAPNTEAGFLHAILAAINDGTYNPAIISISWGQYETGWTPQALAGLNIAFQQAAFLGITVCSAVGDTGAQDSGSAPLNVDFPSSSPYVLACGGTHLIASHWAIIQESVWNDGAQSATGGGASVIFSRPRWQCGVHIPPPVYNPGGKSGRGVPDVAGNADPQTGYQTFINDQFLVIGGTSAVAPLWAGLIARLNQALGRRIGYFNPILYRRINHSQAFHDITIGSNNGYHATTGWDLCTGWGTPRGAPLLNELRAILK